jgi:hypothetical protein
MRQDKHEFTAMELAELDARLYSQADRVVPMRDVWKGDTGPRVLALRHDVDDNRDSFETALRMAEWERDHGYSSTYFLLHGASYWTPENLVRALAFEELGHEVGIHVNAIAVALRERRSPEWILLEALGDLRSVGLRIDGCVAHGDELCGDGFGGVRFVNDEMFVECARPAVGPPVRDITHKGTTVRIEPQPLSDFHLGYDANWLPRARYLSDSGSMWRGSFDEVVEWFGTGQLHMNVHSDWWSKAFVAVVA